MTKTCGMTQQATGRKRSQCIVNHIHSHKMNTATISKFQQSVNDKWAHFSKVKVDHSPYSITERRVPDLIRVLGSQHAGNVSHKPSGRLPLLSAVTPATLKRAATNFAVWWTEARWVWTVCLRLLPDSVTAAIWTWALLCLSRAR